MREITKRREPRPVVHGVGTRAQMQEMQETQGVRGYMRRCVVSVQQQVSVQQGRWAGIGRGHEHERTFDGRAVAPRGE